MSWWRRWLAWRVVRVKVLARWGYGAEEAEDA